MTATAERIQKSPRLIELLAQYHGGMWSGCYSVMSRLFSGQEVLRDDEQVARAIDELRKHRVWASNEAPLTAENESDTRGSHMRDCEELISWLEEHQDLESHRRIGEVDIFIECIQPTSAEFPRYQYRCRLRAHVRTQEWAEWQCTVIEPAHNDVAVDSDEAYDRVARAAMAFALNDDEEDEDRPDDTTRQAFEERGAWCYDEDGTQFEVTRL